MNVYLGMVADFSHGLLNSVNEKSQIIRNPSVGFKISQISITNALRSYRLGLECQNHPEDHQAKEKKTDERRMNECSLSVQ